MFVLNRLCTFRSVFAALPTSFDMKGYLARLVGFERLQLKGRHIEQWAGKFEIVWRNITNFYRWVSDLAKLALLGGSAKARATQFELTGNPWPRSR